MKIKLIVFALTIILSATVLIQTTHKFALELENETPASSVTETDLQTSSIHISIGNMPKPIVQEWHNGSASYGYCSADGKYLTSVSSELKIWEVSSGVLVRALTDDTLAFSQVRILPTENYFVCQNFNCIACKYILEATL